MPRSKESWAQIPLEQRKRHTQPASRAHAVKTIVEQWHELTDDQRAAISQAMAKGGGPK